MSPMLITEMPRVSRSPARLGYPFFGPMSLCDLSLPPAAALLLLYDITDKSSFDNIRVGPPLRSPPRRSQGGASGS